MKTQKNGINRAPFLLLASAVMAMTLVVSGCAMTGIDRSEKAGSTMTDVEKNLNEMITQVDITNASLEELINPNQSNSKKAFKAYSKNVNKIEKQGENLIKQSEEMNALGKDYFEEWRKSGTGYDNSQIQALSEQRRADLTADFARISEASIGVRGSIKSYISNNKDIQTYLSNDLTPMGIQSISPVAKKAIADGEDIKIAIQPILSAIGNAKEKIKVSSTK